MASTKPSVWQRVNGVATWCYRVCAAVVTLVFIISNVRLYGPGSAAYRPDRIGPDVVAQLDFIRHALDRGAGTRMQTLFPEGYFLAHVLYGYTWVEVARRESCEAGLKRRAIEEARWALARIESIDGLAPFDPAMDPPLGAFVLGYRAWLRGGVLMVQGPDERPPAEVAVFERDCETLAGAFKRLGPFVSSYEGQAWPCDGVVGAAALRLHDRVLPPRYGVVVQEWVARAKELVGSGMLPHRWDPGLPPEPARGTSQAVFGRFLVEVDEEWGAREYDGLKRVFMTSLLGLPGTLEYPPGTSGRGDVDSGPLIAGISASGSVFAMAAANVHGDWELADALMHASEGAGLPMSWGGKKRYLLGAVPVGDAFLAWAKSSTRWTGEPRPRVFAPAVSAWWRWKVHGWSVVIAGVLWCGEAWRWWKRRGATGGGHKV